MTNLLSYQTHDNDVCDKCDTCHKWDTHDMCHSVTRCNTTWHQIQGEQKVRERYSHCSGVHIVRLIALKAIPLDFWGHVLSSHDIKSARNIPYKVIVANKKR